MNSSSVRNSPTPSAPEFRQMRHVDEQAGIDVQVDAHAVRGDGRHVLQGAILPLPAGEEAHLVGIGGDHVGRGPQVHLAGRRVDDRRIAGVDALDDAARLADGGDAQRLGDDGDVALPAAVLDDQSAQPLAVVVEQLGRPHGAGDEDGVGRQRRRLVGAGDAAGEDAQQPVGKIVEVALALAPIGIVLAQHARARAVLHALDRRLCREAAFAPPRAAAAPSPGRGRTCGRPRARRDARRRPTGARGRTFHRAKRAACDAPSPAGAARSAGSSAMQLASTTMRGSCSTMWPSAMPSEIGSPWMTADSDLLDLDRRAGARDRARHEMLGDDHRRRLQHLDVLVGVFLLRAVLHDEHAEHLAAALDRHREQRMIDLLARLRPVGERRVARGLGLVDGDVELGAAADEAFAALHARRVHGARVEAFAGEQLERAVLPLEVDRADLGDHHAGDLLDDLVEARLPVTSSSDMISRRRRMITRSAGSDVITRGSSPRLCIGRAARVDPPVWRAHVDRASARRPSANFSAQSASRP